jgi:Type IV secretion system pilin
MLSPLFSQFAATCQDGNFLGLVPWYHYLKASSFDADCSLNSFHVLPSDKVPSDIPLIMLAVIDDLLRIAGIVAVAYVLIGAIQYIISQGSPDKTEQARSTIINALIGAAIATVAVVFIGFVGNQLGG